MKSIKYLTLAGVVFLGVLASIGWLVFFVQKPDVLAKARLRYNQAVSSHVDLSSGPCLGQVDKDWVLDIAHLPRQEIDNLPENQCADYNSGQVRHFVEMSPQGEIIIVQ